MTEREATPRLFDVNLETASWVEGRGVRHTDWSVRVNDTWVPIRELGGVGATMADPQFSMVDDVDELVVLPAGCQYRKTYHPRLAYGTRLQKRVSVPREPPRRASAPGPLSEDEALRNLVAAFPSVKTPLHTTLMEYRVIGPQRLITEELWQRGQERNEGRRKAPTRERMLTVAELERFRDRIRETLFSARGGRGPR